MACRRSRYSVSLYIACMHQELTQSQVYEHVRLDLDTTIGWSCVRTSDAIFACAQHNSIRGRNTVRLSPFNLPSCCCSLCLRIFFSARMDDEGYVQPVSELERSNK